MATFANSLLVMGFPTKVKPGKAEPGENYLVTKYTVFM